MNAHLHAPTKRLVASTVVLLLAACGGGGTSGNAITAPTSTTISSSDGKSSIKLTPSAGTITNAKSIATPASAPANYNYPAGFYGFTISGITPGATVTVTLTTQVGVNPTDYIKCDGQLSNCSRYGQALISGNSIVLTLKDGGAGDEDGKADGIITDPGAPAVALSVPTAAYYMPYASYGNSTGLFLIPTNSLATGRVDALNQSIDFIERNAQLLLNSNGQPYGYDPATAFVIYSTLGMDPSIGDHVYRIDAGAIAGNPVALQLTSYSITGTRCDSTSFSGVFGDNASVVHLLSVSGPDAQCFTDDDEIYAFLPTDTATTAPRRVTGLDSLDAEAFYQRNGTTAPLAGLVTANTKGDIAYYKDLSFSNPKRLLSGQAGDMQPVYQGNGYIFVTITDANAVTSLYRVDATGAISAPLYRYQTSDFDTSELQSGSVLDPSGAFLYFVDNHAISDSNSQITSFSNRLLKVPVDGSAVAQVIYSVADTMPAGAYTPTIIQLNSFIGDQLIFEVQANVRRGQPGYPAKLYAISANAGSSSTPTMLASLNGGYFGYDVIANERIYTNLHTVDANGNEIELSAAVLKTDGSIIKSYPNSEFIGALYQLGGMLPDYTATATSGFLAKGYTAPPLLNSRGYSLQDLGGATMTRISLGDLSESMVLLPSGLPYVLASGDYPYVYDFSGQAITSQQSYSYVSQQYDAAAYNATTNTWIPLTATNSIDEYPL